MKRIDTEGFDVRICEMYNSGMSLDAVAAAMECSASTVLRRLDENGIPRRKNRGFPWGEETRRKLIASRTGRRKRDDYEFGGHERRKCSGNSHIEVYVPNHPRCTKKGFVRKHRLVMERHLGRYLEKGEIVHHKNGIKDDNRIENLEVMSISDHVKLHMPVHYRKRGVT